MLISSEDFVCLSVHLSSNVAPVEILGVCLSGTVPLDSVLCSHVSQVWSTKKGAGASSGERWLSSALQKTQRWGWEVGALFVSSEGSLASLSSGMRKPV